MSNLATPARLFFCVADLAFGAGRLSPQHPDLRRFSKSCAMRGEIGRRTIACPTFERGSQIWLNRRFLRNRHP